MDCEYELKETLDGGMFLHVCANCGRHKTSKYKMSSWVHTVCQSAPPELSIRHRLSNFAKARRKWKDAGQPMRSPDQIESIMDTCRTCEHFVKTDDDTNGCKKCGCKKLLGFGGLRIKIGWATERCPLDPPKWEAEASRG